MKSNLFVDFIEKQIQKYYILMGRGKIDEEEFTVKIYEILLGIIVLGMTQLSQIQVSVEEYNVVAELDYSDTKVSDVAIEADEQENMEWIEGDEEWADRRTKSNSTFASNHRAYRPFNG